MTLTTTDDLIQDNDVKEEESSTAHSGPISTTGQDQGMVLALGLGKAPTEKKVLSALRLLIGFVFLWDFLDKTFGLGVATPPAQSWLSGASPTTGYLTSLNGPAAGALQPLAGQTWVDVVFMLGMLLVGSALILGVALRAAAVGGTLMMAMLWLSALPGKNNPFVDEHVIIAVCLWVLVLAGAGRVWGLDRVWVSLARRPRLGWLRRLG